MGEKKLIILGAGGFGKTIADIAIQSFVFESISFLDDKETGEGIIGVCDLYKKYVNKNTFFFVAFGDNNLRLSWVKKIKKNMGNIINIIHSSAYISPTVKMGIGVAVLPHAVINTNSSIGDGCIINCNSTIDHDCVIEEGSHVCLGATVKGHNVVCRLSKVEAGLVVE